jgi:hypothetical protein
MSGMPHRHGLPTILAAMAAALLFGACGGGSTGDDPSSEAPNDAKRLAFNQCLRKAGVKVHEQTGAGRGVAIEVPRSISEVRMREIERDCVRKTGSGPESAQRPTKEQQAELLDQALEFSRCMRAHGVHMNDPKVEPGGGFGMDSSHANPDSPAFRRAERECGSLMPRKPGAPKSSGGPSK